MVNTTIDMRAHLMALAGVSSTDTRRAFYRDAAGNTVEFRATADRCWDLFGGYWSLFRLADGYSREFPAATAFWFAN